MHNFIFLMARLFILIAFSNLRADALDQKYTEITTGIASETIVKQIKSTTPKRNFYGYVYTCRETLERIPQHCPKYI